jgi:8-oxo-dGTP pyrophosphatase MutT (NUDIX family)
VSGDDLGRAAGQPAEAVRLQRRRVANARPDEDLRDTALRELREETGLELACRPTELGTDEWAVFDAVASADARVSLDDEHDRFEWLPAEAAAAKCLPPFVGAAIIAVGRATAGT